MNDRILMAQIGTAHGIQGEVRVKSFTEDPIALAGYKSLVSESGDAFRITGLRPVKGSMLVVRFKGVATRSAAEALNGIKLFVERDQLPAPDDDEYYQADLIGCAAVSETGTCLGKITAVVNFGAGDLLDIDLSEGSTVLVPFSEIYVPDVDIANRRVTVAALDRLMSDEDDA